VYPISAGIVIQTKELWEELTHALESLSVRLVFELAELPSDWTAFLERIDRVRPEVILIETEKLRIPLDEVMRRIRSTEARPAVIALHTTAEPDAILAALRAGVVEYLHPPLLDPLKAALERLDRGRMESHPTRRGSGKTLAFISAKGGCGATTVACHVAVELPRQTNGSALLADLDFQAGMIGFLVKSKSPYSISDAVNNLQRLDKSYWHGIVSNGIPNLEIITAPSEPANKQISAPQVKQVLSFARAQYDWTVLDLGRNLSTTTLSLLDLIDETYLVTTPEVPALHQTKQMIQILLNSGYPQSSLRLILNRTPKRSEVTLEELEKMLGLKIYATIANDYQALEEAYAEGRLLDPGSSLGKNFGRLAAKIAGVEDNKKKKFSLFG
jgi:pilus assembly protein CpaE